MSIRIICASAFAALSLLGGCASTSQTDTTSATTDHASDGRPIEADSAVLIVNGLSCPLCATNVDKQLLAIPGVSDVRVDLGSGEVTLAFSPLMPHPSRADLRRAVADSGYTLVDIRTN
jgi:copper chaperone CopZ